MVVQVAVAESDTKLESARVYLVQNLRDVEAAAMRRGGLSMDKRMKIRAATTYAMRLSTGVVEQLYEMVGTTAISRATRSSAASATRTPSRSTPRAASATWRLSESTSSASSRCRASYSGWGSPAGAA